ncbi:kinase-like domain-containing protein [Gigaspora rosea]|uniref:Kinase-like domain-containing protein n=1 Tax=Gigaspora rosea TaxID=44941 RepID=A0A397VZE6_9GLOM|nr:kinase-like domain-containing protein [Gigaspora rosea]
MSYSNRIKVAIEQKHIKSFEYSSFCNLELVGSGGFGIVFRADSKLENKHVALKCLHNDISSDNHNNDDEFIREVQNISKINNHDNITKFFGVTHDDATRRCYMILQFASKGNLRNYLHNHFSELDWLAKIKMAKEISSGLDCLHSENLVHRDLHDKNILVHDDGRLMITDFGLSKSLESRGISVHGGTSAFSDPQYLSSMLTYKRNKPSDIYSLGVLFWELSSGVPPFENTRVDEITFQVIFGKREEPVDGTPVDFMNLYCDAWNGDPTLRPNISSINDRLNNLQMVPVYCKDNKKPSENVPSFEATASHIHPLVSQMNDLVKEICNVYEDVECNKDICSIMTDRVKTAEFAMDKMMRGEMKEDHFYERKFYQSLLKFINVLKDIKNFTEKVSKLKGLRKFLNVDEIKNKYEKLIQNYDTCMNELRFTIAIVNEAVRRAEDQRVEEELKALANLNYGIEVNKLEEIAQDIALTKWSEGQENFHTQEINPDELKEHPVLANKIDFRSPIKKLYGNVNVACKRLEVFDCKTEEQLEIIRKLGQSPYILRFYGLSYIDNSNVMVFDWAEYGNLKELNSHYIIPWPRKIQIIRDICRGILFLRSVLDNLNPKLGNFRYSREVDAATRNLSSIVTDIIHWMAPELMDKYKGNYRERNVYTIRSEIYSFGMLIWELCYEKIPYEGWSMREICDHVLGGKREKLLLWNFDNPVDEKIQEEFIKIINKTWYHVPHQRIDLLKLHTTLEKLVVDHIIPSCEQTRLEFKVSE